MTYPFALVLGAVIVMNNLSSVDAFQRSLTCFRPVRNRPSTFEINARGRKTGRNKKERGKTQVTAPPSPTQRTPKTRSVTLTVDPPNESTPLKAVLVEVNDEEWWEAATDDSNEQVVDAANSPYGAKLWPASLGIAQMLAADPCITGRHVLELGCGTALVAQVAALGGAKALATDVSPFVLSLARQGWLETCSQAARDPKATAITGTFDSAIFDMTSSLPLPLPARDSSSCPQQPIVVATAVMYEAELAEALARRVAEAYHVGAWVILGDDDTGNREGGRERFDAELDRLLHSKSDQFVPRKWVYTTVKCMDLGWAQKNIQILQLNRPNS